MRLAYHPDGAWLVEGGGEGNVAIRSVDSDAFRLLNRSPGPLGLIGGLAVTKDYIWAGDGITGQLFRWSFSKVSAGDNNADLLIDENSPIAQLSTTSDERLLLAGLYDGRASVRSLPSGELLAHLIPLRDGSWVTLYPDGRYEASSTGEALSLLVQDPSTRRVSTLDGRTIEATFGETTLTPLAEGSTLVRTTIITPFGFPKVTLDGWPVRSVIPSKEAPLAYDVELTIDDPAGGDHTLEAGSDYGPPIRTSFTTDPDVRAAPTRPRALVIGNSNYHNVPKLPGAKLDAEAVAKALQTDAGWALAALDPKLDLPSKQLTDEVLAFFKNASKGDTLLVYFSGHGFTHKADGEGYLLPIDYDRNKPTEALSATTFWDAVKASPARRILVILDACRSAGFVLPADKMGLTAQELAKQGRRVGFVASTSVVDGALDTKRGGPFTQAFIKALGLVESVNPLTRSVTVQSAFRYAMGAASAQHPHLFGSLDDLPLAWPVRNEASKVVPGADAIQNEWINKVSARLITSTTKQVTPDDYRIEGKTLVIKLTFGHKTEQLRVGIHYPHGDKNAIPRPEVFKRKGGLPGQSTEITVPLGGVFTKGKHRVSIEPCESPTTCGAPEEITVEL